MPFGVAQRARDPNLPQFLKNIGPEDMPAPSKSLIDDAIAVRSREAGNDLDPAAQYWSEAVFANGLLYAKTGIQNNFVQAQAINAKVIYALTMDDRLFIRVEPAGIDRRPDEFTHANFTGGQDIKAAGQIFLRNGRIIRIDNESGHYRPDGKMLRHLVKKLHKEGADLTKALMFVNLGDYKYEAYDAYDYVLGQVTKLPDAEWQSQEVKFSEYLKGRLWNRKPVNYW